MFRVNGTTITLSRGDTGAIRFSANAVYRGTETAYTFGADDRALFSIKAGNGNVVKQKICELTDNAFTIYLTNSDTDKLAAGTYSWDVRYVINPYYDDDGNIIDGDQVITPNLPMEMQLLTVVGEI